MKIQLSNVGEESLSVQMLLGSDVIGKLMTGQLGILSCGLVARETILGWILSGKVPDSEISSCNTMLVASLFVKRWISPSCGDWFFVLKNLVSPRNPKRSFVKPQ
ncbi:hypothetical protein TNIN_493731 [Trichonephila inaurata madagascariensis]|uniref:Peptidase aspartic putative domain-containing protein n=1 Tax=Trichonephila inaurata madagascariensis TaxID=2747483 RepID=A0A8X7C5K2_9ARAC|nr:hypothetical protein TNIN_493731 [Trichonephila inaurata madagascariensis]